MSGVKEYQFPNLSFSGTDMVATCYIPSPDGANGAITQVIGSLQTLTYSIHMERKPVRSIGNINAKAYVMGPRTIAGTLIFAVFNKHFAYEAISEIRTNTGYTNKFLADELPPFNITLSFANEYGIEARMALYGVQIVNEGQVMSINDIYTENTYQFVATDIEYLSPADETIKNTIGGNVASSASIASNNGPQAIASSSDSNSDGEGKKLASGAIVKSHIPHQSTNDSITLSVVNLSEVKNQSQKGVAEFKLSPPQISGHIIINGYNLPTTKIDMSTSAGSLVVGTRLYAGKYTAQYVDIDTNRRSNIVDFSIRINNTNDDEYSAPPIIDFVSENKITVYCSSKLYNFIRYAVSYDSGFLDYRYAPIQNRIAIISGLSPDTAYTISAYNSYNNTFSHSITVRTLQDNVTQYAAIKDLVKYNSNSLQSWSINEYHAEIDKAMALPQKDSMHEAMYLIKKSYEKELNLLDESNYPTRGDYDEAVKDYTNKIALCTQIIKTIEPIINNRSERIAFDSLMKSDKRFFIEQPKPRLTGGIDGIFVVPSSVTAIDIQNINNDKKQLITSFSTMDATKTFKFFGDPNERYLMRASNNLKYVSPLYEFYSMSDSEKTATRSNILRNNELQNNEITSAEERFGEDANKLNLSMENHKRVIIELYKTAQQPIFPKPTIVIDGPMVSVHSDADFIVGSIQKRFYVVLSEIDDIYGNTMKQKLQITYPTVQSLFNSYDHSIKPGKSYCVWIEDSEHVQVSDSTTFIYRSEMSDEELDQEEEIRSFFMNKKVNQVRDLVFSKIGSNESLNSLFFMAQYDTYATIQNLYEYITEQVVLDKVSFPDNKKIIKAVYESKMELEYYIIDDFFNSPIDINRKTMITTFPSAVKNYMLNSISIMQDGSCTFSNSETSNLSKEFVPTGQEKFIMLYTTEDNVLNKSGFVLIDPLSKNVLQYKLRTEVN